MTRMSEAISAAHTPSRSSILSDIPRLLSYIALSATVLRILALKRAKGLDLDGLLADEEFQAHASGAAKQVRKLFPEL